MPSKFVVSSTERFGEQLLIDEKDRGHHETKVGRRRSAGNRPETHDKDKIQIHDL